VDLQAKSESKWLTASAGLALGRELFGRQMARWRCVSDEEAAVEAAAQFGGQVAMKLSAPGLVHKTEASAVITNVRGPHKIRRAYHHLTALAELHHVTDSSEVIVQEMVAAGTEIIVGILADTSFGYVATIGVGGIFVELVDDVTCAVCPLGRDAVDTMLWRLRAYKLLAGFRSKPAVDMEELARAILAVGGAAGIDTLKEHGVAELEVNPLISTESAAVAVDVRARVGQARNLTPADQSPRLEPALDRVFHARSLALIGTSDNQAMPNRILQHTIDYGFSGKVFLVNPRRKGEVHDAYVTVGSVAELPEPVDYALIAVRADAVPGVLREAGGKVGIAQVLSAGFGEAGPSGRELEQRALSAAQQVGLRFIGPNSLGLHSTDGRITFVDGITATSGSVSVIAQSGGLAADILRDGVLRGVRFNKVVSAGNSIDISPEDLLAYLVGDESTHVIGMHLEGTRAGARLRALFERCTVAGKKVALLRGGRQARGAAAAMSHTGALVSDERIWMGLAAQTGIAYVTNVERLLNALVAFQELRSTNGNRVLLVGPSGGAAVLATDRCVERGLDVPPLPPDLIEGLGDIGFPPGTSLRNPIDTPAGALAIENGAILGRVIRRILDHTVMDFVIVHVNARNAIDYTANGADVLRRVASDVAELGADANRPTQFLFAIHTTQEPKTLALSQSIVEIPRSHRIPSFFSLEDAIDAISYMTPQVEYFRQ
jgi:acyl-CoA synthetase (NDP forming)